MSDELERDVETLASVLRIVLRKPYVDDENMIIAHPHGISIDSEMADAIRRRVEQ